jgi:hypothetical protein
MQNLYHSTWDHGILISDTYLGDEQLLIRPFLRETKNTNVAGGWNLKLTFCVMAATREVSHLDKHGSVQ